LRAARLPGGRIPSTVPGEKATFAFSGKCRNTTLENGQEVYGVTKGQLQYNDRAAGVKFHAKLGEGFSFGSSDPCGDVAEAGGNSASFSGLYRVSGGPKEAEGFVEIVVIDNGEPGINGDEVTINVVDGPYDGYYNSGTLQGGNVQVH
jgi:hypothetical protein